MVSGFCPPCNPTAISVNCAGSMRLALASCAALIDALRLPAASFSVSRVVCAMAADMRRYSSAPILPLSNCAVTNACCRASSCSRVPNGSTSRRILASVDTSRCSASRARWRASVVPSKAARWRLIAAVIRSYSALESSPPACAARASRCAAVNLPNACVTGSYAARRRSNVATCSSWRCSSCFSAAACSVAAAFSSALARRKASVVPSIAERWRVIAAVIRSYSAVDNSPFECAVRASRCAADSLPSACATGS